MQSQCGASVTRRRLQFRKRCCSFYVTIVFVALFSNRLLLFDSEMLLDPVRFFKIPDRPKLRER